MVQCEMCGTETASPTTAKIEGAELQVCDSCAGFGTEVSSADASSTTTKYSTSGSGGGNSSSSSGSTSTSTSSGGTRGGGRSRRDMFDEMDTLADDYNDRIRAAREDRGLSQEELAGQLNEKASLIRKLERADMQPSDAIQRKIERKLDISLSAGEGEAEGDWESDVTPGETTLGDVVRRGE